MCLRITVRIAEAARTLQMLSIARRTVIMISSIREFSSIIPEDLYVIRCYVKGRTCVQVARTAPSLCLWVDDHLAVSGDIGCDISITRFPIVLPAAADVYEIELAVRPPASLHFKCQSNFEVGRLWKLI